MRQMRLRKPGSRASNPDGPSARERAAKRAAAKRSATRPAGRREATTDRFSSASSVARRSGTELAGIGRELIAIPAGLYMRFAEWLGAIVLAAWLRLWPFIVRGWRLAAGGLAWAQRAATPARVTVAVALLTAGALAGSQWADLSGISVGTNSYIEVEDVAPAPQVSTKTVGSAHAWAGVPLAIAAALIVILAARGRPRLTWLLVPIGAAVVAISLIVDRPEGLDRGSEAVAYESVTADLLPGFWAQLVSGVVLILLAAVLNRVLQPDRTASHPSREGRARANDRSRRRPRSRGARRAAEAGQ